MRSLWQNHASACHREGQLKHNGAAVDFNNLYFGIYMKTCRARDPFKLIEKVYDNRLWDDE